jgi:hypothetical protein
MDATIVRLTMAAAVVIATAGCVERVPLHTADTNLAAGSGYVTFFVLPGNSSGNVDVDAQLKTAIVNALADRGLVETTPQEAEAVVVPHTATSAIHSRDGFYKGWGGWAWHTNDAQSRNGTESYNTGAVVVDIFDAWSKQLVWHGAAHAAKPVDETASAHRIERAVNSLFKDFPQVDRQAHARSVGLRRPSAASPGQASLGTPMHIVFASGPAILIRLDGEPKYEDVNGTELQRMTNADGFIIRDESSIYYLNVGGRWLEASEISGSWSLAGSVPDGADLAREAYLARHPDPYASVQPHGPAPAVVVAQAPAELIITDGEPAYADVSGTSLLRMRNANATVFQEPTDHELYVHLPAGWFRSWTTNGPWQGVNQSELPADLARVTARSGPA